MFGIRIRCWRSLSLVIDYGLCLITVINRVFHDNWWLLLKWLLVQFLLQLLSEVKVNGLLVTFRQWSRTVISNYTSLGSRWSLEIDSHSLIHCNLYRILWDVSCLRPIIDGLLSRSLLILLFRTITTWSKDLWFLEPIVNRTLIDDFDIVVIVIVDVHGWNLLFLDVHSWITNHLNSTIIDHLTRISDDVTAVLFAYLTTLV